MRERIDLHAHWASRKESVDECAGRVSECLQRLAACDAGFSQWFLLSKQPKRERKFEPTFESCRDLLAKGRNRRDTDQSIIEELGYNMWLSNGLEDDWALGIRFYCGAYPPAHMLNPNNCVIDLPYGGLVAGRIFQAEKLRCIMSAVIESWNPDWARISTFQMRQSLYPQTHQGVEVGWLTYLSDRYGPLPKLPNDCEVTSIDGLGSLIVLKGIDRLTASNPEHVAALRRLSGVLKDAGLLAPTPPHVAA